MMLSSRQTEAFDRIAVPQSPPPVADEQLQNKKQIQKNDIDDTGPCRFWGSARMIYTVCAFLAMAVHLYMRNTLNFVILCMVKHNDTVMVQTMNHSSDANADGINERCGPVQRYTNHSMTASPTGELEWSRTEEIWLQGSFYYGYVLMLPIAGRLSDRFGGKLLFVHSITGQALTFLIMPFCARYSYIAMIAALIVQGLIAGCGNPAIYQLFSTWAHPSERTALVSFAFGGYSVGAVLVFPISSFLCQFGWDVAFYAVGVVCLVCGICFHWLVYSTLEDHPRLSRNEYNYLKEANMQKKTQAATPWKAIVTSAPILAYTFTHIFHSYGLIVFTIMIPRYFSEAMRFPLDEVGLLSSVPFLGSFISKTITITACSIIEKRPNLNLTRVRRITYVICNCLCIFCILGMILAECSHKLLVILLTVGIIVVSDLAFSGAYFPSLLYIAPAYSGLISGISNCLATMSGFLAPLFISQIVQEGLKLEWDFVMLTLIISYGLGAAVYGLFGSSKLQKWGQG